MATTTRPASLRVNGETIALEPVAWMVGNCPTFDHLPVERLGALTPLHEVTDWDKAVALAESIARDGWQGAPLVVWGEQLLTGTHRYMACQLLGLDDADIPTVTIADVFAAAGQDYDAAIAAAGFGDEWAALNDLLVAESARCGYGLPGAVRAEYGIDWE